MNITDTKLKSLVATFCKIMSKVVNAKKTELINTHKETHDNKDILIINFAISYYDEETTDFVNQLEKTGYFNTVELTETEHIYLNQVDETEIKHYIYVEMFTETFKKFIKTKNIIN